VERRAIALALLLALSACAGSEGAVRADTTTTVAKPAAAGCTGSATVPPGARTEEVVDVDGDGRRDTAYTAYTSGDLSDLRFGIVTAAGGTSSVPFESASPVERRGMVVDADERGPVEIFLSDGRGAALDVFVDCRITPVLDDRAEPYSFDRGFRGTGTGFGCMDADGDGRRDLVGLLGGFQAESRPTVEWSRTIIGLDGTTARNGRTDHGTYQRGRDDARIDRLFQFTCGDLTMQDAVGIG
jgi:hypothetical protein